ncbi:hypothetical protein F441_14638, partial [Phytophthora nicotianae CJ01A1]
GAVDHHVCGLGRESASLVLWYNSNGDGSDSRHWKELMYHKVEESAKKALQCT